MIIDVDCLYGKGKVNIYECNKIIVDPSLIINMFYNNYRVVDQVVVVLPLLEALSRGRDLNLDNVDNCHMPNLVFDIN